MSTSGSPYSSWPGSPPPWFTRPCLRIRQGFFSQYDPAGPRESRREAFAAPAAARPPAGLPAKIVAAVERRRRCAGPAWRPVTPRSHESGFDLHLCRQLRLLRAVCRGSIDDSGRGTCHMTFKVGDTVVYPHHGAARIEEIEVRSIKGEERMYLVLKVDKGDLTVRVPADNAELVGVRDVVGQEGLERVFEVLRAPYTEEPTNWSRRYKANLEKLASGDVNKVAEV